MKIEQRAGALLCHQPLYTPTDEKEEAKLYSNDPRTRQGYST